MSDDPRDQIPPRCPCCGLPGHGGDACPNIATVVTPPVDLMGVADPYAVFYPDHVVDIIRADVAEKRVKELEAEKLVLDLKLVEASEDIVELKEQRDILAAALRRMRARDALVSRDLQAMNAMVDYEVEGALCEAGLEE